MMNQSLHIYRKFKNINLANAVFILITGVVSTDNKSNSVSLQFLP
jgi:hypothetical protein